MMRSIMARYSPNEATIILIDPRRRSVGVVPDEWLSRYSYAQGIIADATHALLGENTTRGLHYVAMTRARVEAGLPSGKR
jgi:hypothetical protein